MLGIIGGTSLSQLDEIAFLEKEEKQTSYGKIFFYSAEEFVFVPRHFSQEIPAHKVNFHGILELFSLLEIKHVLGVNSVGSLHKELEPGTLFVPNDFFCPWKVPTFFDKERVHATPCLNEKLRSFLVKVCKDHGQKIEQGIYVQSIGPRLETPSEIRFFSQVGDVVGMTMATEATLACELDLRYASLCTVDNYANGIVSEIEFADILEGASCWNQILPSILSDLIERV